MDLKKINELRTIKCNHVDELQLNNKYSINIYYILFLSIDIPHNVVYSYTMPQRKYFSIYFKNGDTQGRKKRDVTISFEMKDVLYEKCRKLGSSDVKKIIGINSYKDLVDIAKQEGRPIGNLIKYRLKDYFDKNE
jgi:hypothetical protein